MTPSHDRWFTEEVLAHEDALMRYLHRHWHRRDEIADLRQELYARIYEAALRERPAQPKAFLFSSARHLMADRIRRWIGDSMVSAIEKLMGLVLTAVAVEMILAGLKRYFLG